MDKIKLKPCPFCGGNMTFLSKDGTHKNMLFVLCFECGSSGPVSFSEVTAKILWNSRMLDNAVNGG